MENFRWSAKDLEIAVDCALVCDLSLNEAKCHLFASAYEGSNEARKFGNILHCVIHRPKDLELIVTADYS